MTTSKKTDKMVCSLCFADVPEDDHIIADDGKHYHILCYYDTTETK